MKQLLFIDSKAETYIMCTNILKYRITWRIKIKTLSPIGSKMRVYENSSLKSEIYVKYEGCSKYGDRQYSYIYKQNGKVRSSYQFTASLLYGLRCCNLTVESAYNEIIYGKIKKEWVDKAENLKEPGSIVQISYDELTERGYDNIADDWGHDVVTGSIERCIKYVGRNPKNGHREYIFVRDGDDINLKFEIIGEW